MFRTMRRFKQQISEEECIRILQEEKRGILSMHGEDGYPYGIPMNHWYNPEDGKLYFHGAKTGHKIDAITKDNRVSYCVHDAGYRKEGEWALNISSVVVFGRISLVTDEEKVRMEAPEIFRVLGKRRPEFVRPYAELLRRISETDNNRVVKIHCSGALKAVSG
ncbi:MAG: pyridoxamine 5'-phosphate oxidase family protein [Clostridia bacterium]|nr:pyridoxamine 5'-phosphate oxidase family protein [Clostridia bacterium]